MWAFHSTHEGLLNHLIGMSLTVGETAAESPEKRSVFRENVFGYRGLTDTTGDQPRRQLAAARQVRTATALVVRYLNFEGSIPVMPAQAGIQRFHAQAAGQRAWIPAFAGMTLPPSTPQNRDRVLET